jgi:hypothetical protein
MLVSSSHAIEHNVPHVEAHAGRREIDIGIGPRLQRGQHHSAGFIRRRGGFFIEGVERLFEQLVGVVQMAVLNFRVDALHQLRVMDFKVHFQALPFKVIVNRRRDLDLSSGLRTSRWELRHRLSHRRRRRCDTSRHPRQPRHPIVLSALEGLRGGILSCPFSVHSTSHQQNQ